MRKLIALRFGLSDFWHISSELASSSSELKQHSLLFDQIGILNLQYYLNLYKEISPNIERIDSAMSEIEWLRDNDVIFEPSVDLEEISSQSNIQRHYSNSSKMYREFFEQSLRSKTSPMHKKWFQLGQAASQENSIALRLIALQIETAVNFSVVPIIPSEKYYQKLQQTKKSDAMQIVINKLPLPDNTTPWEQLIDYRNDPDNKKNLLTLRRWIRKISSEELSKAEIEEEIEWLINEFQNHMKFHKLKENMETLEVMVKAPLEILENLIKLKFSKIPEPFFALKKRQINLMEAELNAPGREISYIIKTQEAFQSHE